MFSPPDIPYTHQDMCSPILVSLWSIKYTAITASASLGRFVLTLQEQSSNNTCKESHADALSAANSTVDWQGGGAVSSRSWRCGAGSSTGRRRAVGAIAATSRRSRVDRSRGRTAITRTASWRRLSRRRVDGGGRRSICRSRAVAGHGVGRDGRGNRSRIVRRRGGAGGDSRRSAVNGSRAAAVIRGRVGGSRVTGRARRDASGSRGGLSGQGDNGGVGRKGSGVGR